MKSNKLQGPWTADPQIRLTETVFPIYDISQTQIGGTFKAEDALMLTRFPSLYHALVEAAFEYCHKCLDMHDMPQVTSDELIQKGCILKPGTCFVQRWLKLLAEIRTLAETE